MNIVNRFVISAGILLTLTITIFVRGDLLDVNAQVTLQELNSMKEEVLETQLQLIEKQIEKEQANLSVQKSETATIERDINILDSKINEANLKINASQITIVTLEKQIGEKAQSIESLTEQIEENRINLSEIVRNVNEFNDYSLVEVALANENLSDFFEQYDNLVTFNELLYDNLHEFRYAKQEIENQRLLLTDKQRQEEVEKIKLAENKNVIDANKKQKSVLKSLSEQEEQEYEVVIAAKEAQKRDVLNQLFSLRDSQDINFEQAYNLAKVASANTGVRVEFILAVIEQESSLGKNVGRCNIPGQDPSLMWYTIMPGPNSNSNRDDQSAYLRIVSALGLGPEDKPLSCPLSIGWGGAMGPAQFIPTTWEAYGHRVAAINGRPANPWNAQDAFTASALFLGDLGGVGGNYYAEQEAAARYYAGGNWQANGLGYANSVLERAAKFAGMIATIEG